MGPESAEAAASKKADEPAGLLDQQQLSIVDKDLDGRIATRRRTVGSNPTCSAN